MVINSYLQKSIFKVSLASIYYEETRYQRNKFHLIRNNFELHRTNPLMTTAEEETILFIVIRQNKPQP